MSANIQPTQASRTARMGRPVRVYPRSGACPQCGSVSAAGAVSTCRCYIALTTIPVTIRADSVIRMTAWAGCSVCGAMPPAVVHANGNSFQVVGVNAGSMRATIPSHTQRVLIMAAMVKCKSLRNRANYGFVNPAVRGNVMPFTNCKAPIAVRPSCGFPYPTGRSLFDVEPEPLINGHVALGKLAENRIAMSAPSIIVLAAPNSCKHHGIASGDATLVSHRKVTPFVAMPPDANPVAVALI